MVIANDDTSSRIGTFDGGRRDQRPNVRGGIRRQRNHVGWATLNALNETAQTFVAHVDVLEIDFREKAITRAGEESAQISHIKSVSVDIDGKLIVQGVEDGDAEERDGAGWSVSIMDPEGTMVMAIAGDGFGIMGLGACTPKP